MFQAVLERSSVEKNNLGMNKKCRKSTGRNFYRRFVSNIWLTLQLAGSNLLQTLLNPPQVLQHKAFLSGGHIVFANEEKNLVV